MELRHLRYFVAVADELHFGRAADKLHISQPPLSHQIQDLERELGVDLFHRTRHFVALTEAGRAFLEEARPILQATDHAVATARKAGRAEVGRLSVGVGQAAETRVLGKALNAFLARHSNVVLDLHTLDSREQIEALATRRIDIAFPILPVSHRDIVAEAIATEPLVAALPAAHHLARARRLRLADLRSDPSCAFHPTRGPRFTISFQRACAEAGFAPSIVHEAGHILTVLGLVGAGLGVAILPGSLGSRPTEGVVFRPLTAGAAGRNRCRLPPERNVDAAPRLSRRRSSGVPAKAGTAPPRLRRRVKQPTRLRRQRMKAPLLARAILSGFLFLFAFAATYLVLDSLGRLGEASVRLDSRGGDPVGADPPRDTPRPPRPRQRPAAGGHGQRALTRRRPPPLQPKRVAHDEEARKHHGGGGDDGPQEAEGRHQNADGVVAERPDEVLPHDTHGPPGEDDAAPRPRADSRGGSRRRPSASPDPTPRQRRCPRSRRREGRSVVDAVSDHHHAACEPSRQCLKTSSLACGSRSRACLIEARLFRGTGDTGGPITGQERNLQTERLQVFDRGARLRPHRILKPNHGDESAVDRNAHGTVPGARIESIETGNPVAGKQGTASEQYSMRTHPSACSSARNHMNLARLRNGDPSLTGAGHDRPRKRMVDGRFNRRRTAQDVLLRHRLPRDRSERRARRPARA